jgi:hypothetical protein
LIAIALPPQMLVEKPPSAPHARSRADRPADGNAPSTMRTKIHRNRGPPTSLDAWHNRPSISGVIDGAGKTGSWKRQCMG